MTDWNIQSRAHACSTCEKAFAHKELYHTVLMAERAEFKRSDVCQACWEREFGDGVRDRKGFISYWHGVYQAPPPPEEAIQKETAESLLRKLIEMNDPRFISVGYILAVMLERKRILKVKEQIKRDGHRYFLYEHPGTGDLFTILDPDLQLNQLEQVQKDVADLLEHGLNAPQFQKSETTAANTVPDAEHPATPTEPQPTPSSESPS